MNNVMVDWIPKGKKNNAVCYGVVLSVWLWSPDERAAGWGVGGTKYPLKTIGGKLKIHFTLTQEGGRGMNE